MAPTLYDHSSGSMDEELNPVLQRRKLRWWWIPVVLVVVILLVMMIFFAVKANSKACKDGFRAEQECQNFTSFLEHELTQTKKVLQGTEIQAATCNQTVVTLTASLEMEKAQGHKLQEIVQELQGEIATLKQKLQETSTELEQLRKKYEIPDEGNGSTSFRDTISPFVVALLLTLVLEVLLA